MLLQTMSNSLTKGCVKRAFADIKPSWKKLLLSKKIKPHLRKCFAMLNARLTTHGVTQDVIEDKGLAHFIRPAPEDIFAAFKHFEVHETKVIIIGQDPYPKSEEAQGLSFSAPRDVKTPSSLRNIYKCLVKQGLVSKTPEHGNLEGWAEQGVLLLNRYLTRNPTIEIDDAGCAYVKNNGKSTKHCIHEFWADFTGAVVKAIVEKQNAAENYVSLMLWGQKAQEITGDLAMLVMRDEVEIQQWSHPSTASPINQKPGPKNFENCDHFTYVNEQLTELGFEPIDWSRGLLPKPKPRKQKKKKSKSKKSKPKPRGSPPVVRRVVVFTDGGCTNNGKKNAKATYGVYFPEEFNGVVNEIQDVEISGVVPKNTQTWEKDDFEVLDHTDGKLVKPSNNRGELLAVIHALNAILKHHDTTGRSVSILLVTDSEYCMHIINERVWRWHKQNSTFKQKANPDLVSILYQQLQALAPIVLSKELLQPAAHNHYKTKTPMDLEWHGLTVLHENSHKKGADIPAEGTMAYELHMGNERADELCGLNL